MPRRDPGTRTVPSPGTRRRPLTAVLLALLLWLTGGVVPAEAQDTPEIPPPERLAVFLDCGFCDESFIREELTWVNYVRDREAADVHVLVTRQQAGAGGRAVTFDLIGRRAFAGMDYSTVYTSSVGATQSEQRDGLVRTLRAALVPYVMRTPLADRVNIVVDEPSEAEGDRSGAVDDPWNQWTVEIYADGNASFESRQRSASTRYGIYVNRVTEEWKIQLRPFFNYSYSRFDREAGTITSTSRRDGFTSYVVRSVSPHWSVGGFGDIYSATFDNVDMRYRLMPAVEYSLYPYAEASRRQLTVAYRAGVSHVAYRDTTIFDQIEEVLPEHTLNVGYAVTQPWGQINVGMGASQYLHEMDRYSMQFGSSVDIRITQGLSIGIGGSYRRIRNQLNLPRGDADLEEVLLRRRQLATGYQAGMNFGFRYRFGSIYSNVVNPRLTGGGGQDRF